MALHPDAQRAAFALRILLKAFLREIQLRQQAIGNRKQVLTGLGQSQAAALAEPDIRTQLLLQLFHGVAEGGLRYAEDVRRRGERAVFVHRLDNGQVNSLKHAGT